MNATVSAPSVGIAGQTITSTRVVSIDIFRGITMAVMIFVNDLDSVHGLSKWTYHMPENVDAMTYVDMVFPAFLFIVGMALPIAVRQRLKRNASVASLWLHVVLRSLALLVLGLILANAERGDPARMHISPNAWALLALGGGILLWNVYSGSAAEPFCSCEVSAPRSSSPCSLSFAAPLRTVRHGSGFRIRRYSASSD
jgi:hypothetical protein